MSDVSQGPGWWMASDHKWYPPESHPDYRPPPPAPSPMPTAPLAYPPGAPSYAFSPMAPPSAGPVLASYGQRLGGWLIDWVLLLVVTGLVSLVTHSFHHYHTVTLTNGGYVTSSGYHLVMPGELLTPLIVILYGTVLCGHARGQTLGMMAAGTKAVKIHTGQPIGYAAALGRAVFEWLLAILLLIPWIVDMLFPLWDSQNQTLHDKVSGTIVIKVLRA